MSPERSPWIDDELAMLQEHVARFVAGELAPHRERWDRNGQVDRASWARAAEAGLLCASIPVEYGGGGGTLAHEAVIHQELSRAGLGGSFGTGNTIHSAIVAHYILAYGDEAQKRRWLPAMARGERIGAIAMTEPGGGSDLQGLRTRANPAQGGWLLSGAKTFISNGQTADLIVVAARTGEAGAKGISLLVLEGGEAEGFRRGRNLEKVGMRGQDTSELFFDDMFVPAGNLLGSEGGGFALLMHQLAWERMTIALDAVVNMERAVALTTDYVRDRKAFGKTLLDFQNTQFVLADCATQASVARAFADSLMVRLLAGNLDAISAAKAKLWTTETQCKVIDACQQLFGGYGYMTEYPIARMFADARVSRIYGGTNEIMKLIIARAL
ncbi:acyl-CoA dehydrogenase family protein [Sphingomonas canadensis]|uniref:Acyl-CoA dehydrogenase family protein n=1 Tax=Sphingomonas canadensis TaxID=1219257 RepID=A0ABW3H7I2_9SPHN|nr:acyl-CoA dehydrogenase family protein [Sphingomonas canadensis]MCW3834484.1 acyl-CoA dehydrogenase family protein [Sphingomonas canadensis]